jgi:hypothetical protein
MIVGNKLLCREHDDYFEQALLQGRNLLPGFPSHPFLSCNIGRGFSPFVDRGVWNSSLMSDNSDDKKEMAI